MHEVDLCKMKFLAASDQLQLAPCSFALSILSLQHNYFTSCQPLDHSWVERAVITLLGGLSCLRSADGVPAEWYVTNTL